MAMGGVPDAPPTPGARCRVSTAAFVAAAREVELEGASGQLAGPPPIQSVLRTVARVAVTTAVAAPPGKGLGRYPDEYLGAPSTDTEVMEEGRTHEEEGPMPSPLPPAPLP